jgi:hypothetical protein
MTKKNYICKFCEYSTIVKYNYDKHCGTYKHQRKVMEDVKKKQISTSENIAAHKHMCKICNKYYARKSTLVRHNKSFHKDNLEISMFNKCAIDIYGYTKKDTKKTPDDKNNDHVEALPGSSQVSLDGLTCLYCGLSTSKSSNRVRHEAKCSAKKIKEIEAELSVERERNKLNERHINLLLEDKKNLTELSIQSAKNNSKAMSALGYIIYNYPNGSPLEHISSEKMEQIIYAKKEENTPIERSFILYYKAKSLHKHIGDAIIDVYKCDDPSKQSFHATDCSRLNYIVMAAIGDNKEWIQDKGGIKVNENIISPVMKKIGEITFAYMKEIVDGGMMIEKEDRDALFGLVDDIEDGKLQKQVNTYIAPFFTTTLQEKTTKNDKKKKIKKTTVKKIDDNIRNKVKKPKKKPICIDTSDTEDYIMSDSDSDTIYSEKF